MAPGMRHDVHRPPTTANAVALHYSELSDMDGGTARSRQGARASGIVYVLSRDDSEVVAAYLRARTPAS